VVLGLTESLHGREPVEENGVLSVVEYLLHYEGVSDSLQDRERSEIS